MMSSQMKLTTCQWHSLHRALVCRLYHTGQQSDGRSNQTRVCHMSHPHNTNSRPVVSMARDYSQYTSRRDCTCRIRVQSVSRPLWRVPERCASTKTSSGKTKSNILSLKSSRYVLTQEMASLLIDKIWHGESIPSDRLIIEVNPGPGYLTKELLNRGAKKVVGVERKRNFMPDLSQLAKESNERLKVHCGNYFGLNQCKSGDNYINFEDVFEGVEPLPWKADEHKFAANVIGIIPKLQEKGNAFSLAANLLKRSKAFHYGRVQHSLLMAEKIYRTIVQEPCGRLTNYGNISALFQLCCDVKLLHIEPSSSFRVNVKSSQPKKPENLCLVQLTPKLDVFDGGLTEEASYLFVFFLGQMLMKRTALLKDKLEVWAPGHTDIIYDHNFSDKTRTGDLSGTDYLNLFKAIQHLDTFSDWMSMHVCNISPEEVSGYRDGYMYADQISDHGDMVEDDYEERDAALHY